MSKWTLRKVVEAKYRALAGRLDEATVRLGWLLRRVVWGVAA
jgi:hypothetical protein